MDEVSKTGVGEREQRRRQTLSVPDRAAWSINDGARRIGVGRTTIYKLAAEGKIRLVKVAGRTLIPDEELVRLIKGGTGD
jgi:excisionase family DNA binding protein